MSSVNRDDDDDDDQITHDTWGTSLKQIPSGNGTATLLLLLQSCTAMKGIRERGTAGIPKRNPGPRFWCKKYGFKNGFEIGFRYHFDFVTCANYPFSDFFQCKKSKAISKANFKAIFKAKIVAP